MGTSVTRTKGETTLRIDFPDVEFNSHSNDSNSSNSTNHLREITLKPYSVVKEELNFSETDYPAVPSTFTKISHLRNSSPGSVVDVIGVCVFVTLVHKGACRSVLIQDDSSAEIPGLTQQCCGLILSVAGCATVDINPDLPEAVLLSDWFDSHGSTVSFTSLSRVFLVKYLLLAHYPNHYRTIRLYIPTWRLSLFLVAVSFTRLILSVVVV
uniref:Uncharacterized protein n=1 Tax=Tetranychus urticae TaxID=32264 RepID=T1K424_TETUR